MIGAIQAFTGNLHNVKQCVNELLAVPCFIQQKTYQFMLDSGATNNFISYDLCKQLGFNASYTNTSKVNLANGKSLQVSGKVTTPLQLPQFQTEQTFIVVKADIPPILGMPFLKKLNPFIDWQRRLMVTKFGKHTVTTHLRVFGKSHIQKSTSQRTPCHQIRTNARTGCNVGVQMSNEFFGLQDSVALQNNDIVLQSSVKVPHSQNFVRRNPKSGSQITPVQGCTPVGSPTISKDLQSRMHDDKQPNNATSAVNVMPAERTKLQKTAYTRSKQCTQATRHILNDMENKNSNVIINQTTSLKQQQKGNIEICTLRKFVKGHKKKAYKSACLVLVGHPEQTDEYLNFTHRAAFGSYGEGDVHGNLENLAKNVLQELETTYSDVFKEPTYPVDRGKNNALFEHVINLKDPYADPPKKKLYPLDPNELEELKTQIEQLLADNRIVVSNSPYGAPILFARKKDGRLRMCIDYRQLNSNTIVDSYPLPRIDELTCRLNGAQVFSKIDLNNAYHQLPMKQADMFKTAFCCRYGTYEFTVMPFGLCNAPSTFQRVMNRVFFPLLDKGVLIYLDDILVYSKTIEQHKHLLQQVFELLQKNQLHVKSKKCALFLESVEFLGYKISSQGVHVEQGKVQAIHDWPIPKNLTEVQSFLGLCNYYRKFIFRFSQLAQPLTALTKKDVKFVWQDIQQKAFDALKKCLTSAPVLKLYDSSKQTRIICDASNFCIGSILEQLQDDGNWYPVEFYSKKLNNAEQNYSATEREFLAIKQSLERWRHFLIGQKFCVLTDHAALTYLTKQSHLSRRQARWLSFFQEFTFDIEHVRGKDNVADYLSRIPVETEQVNQFEHSCQHSLGLCTLMCKCFTPVKPKLAPNQRSHNSNLQVEAYAKGEMNGVITLNEEQTFLQSVLDIQKASVNEWFANQKLLALNADIQHVQYRDDIVCKLVKDKWCPIIPPDEKQIIYVILSDLHSSQLGGHVGVRKLLQLVQKRFYWINMYNDVNKYCKECLKCQQTKISTQKQQGLLQPLEYPEQCFQHISMDFIGPLPKTVRGHDCIFSVVDRFSKLSCFIPCQTTWTAADVAQALFNNWICKYGLPQKIISDRDTRFTSNFWNKLFDLLGCRIALSTAYHPQSDGLTERYHRSIEQVLRSYVDIQQSNWDLVLAQCEFALNNTVQVSTQHSPFYIVYGKNPTLSFDIALQKLQDNKLQHVSDLILEREKVQKFVQVQLQKSQQQMVVQANKKRRSHDIVVGQYAWLQTDHLQLPANQSKKLAPRWVGPFLVLQEVNTNAFKLKLPQKMKLHPVFNVSQLKAHHGPLPREQEPAFVAEDDEEYEIEAILQHRVGRRDQIEYLIRWKGFDLADDTWEPESNLENAEELLTAYKQRMGLV